MTQLDETFRRNRRTLWVSLWDCGATLVEIGEAFQVSRERVRQVIGNRGQGPKVDPIRVLRVVRSDRTIKSWNSICKATGNAETTLRAMLQSLDLAESVGRLFRMRFSAYNRGRRLYEGTRSERQRAACAVMRERALANGSIPHGTANGYTNYRCRCDICRQAANARNNAAAKKASMSKARRRGCPPDKHGTTSGYAYYACRCELCRANQAAKWQARKARRETV